MKTTLIILAMCLGQITTQAQKLKDAEVPASVKESFNKQYPGAKVEKWEKEGTSYEAEFDHNKTETCAVYSADGKFLESEIEIKASELPKNILEYFSKNFPGKKIKEASKITDANGKITYEAEIEDTDYLFDGDCKFIGKEEEADKKDDKD